VHHICFMMLFCDLISCKPSCWIFYNPWHSTVILMKDRWISMQCPLSNLLFHGVFFMWLSYVYLFSLMYINTLSPGLTKFPFIAVTTWCQMVRTKRWRHFMGLLLKCVVNNNVSFSIMRLIKCLDI
jgi:hypothetical protein